jgi:transposase-like protein
MDQRRLCPILVACPYCQAKDHVVIHSHKERRYICHACGRTFAETQGTPLCDRKYPTGWSLWS